MIQNVFSAYTSMDCLMCGHYLETTELEHQTAYNMWGKCTPQSYLKPLSPRSADLQVCTLTFSPLIYPGLFSETPGVYTQVSSQNYIKVCSKGEHPKSKKMSWVLHQLDIVTAYQPHFSAGPNEFDICKGHLSGEKAG